MIDPRPRGHKANVWRERFQNANYVAYVILAAIWATVALHWLMAHC